MAGFSFGRGGGRGGGKGAVRGGGPSPEMGGGAPRPEAKKGPSRAEARKAWLKRGAERLKSILLLRGIRKQKTPEGALNAMAGNPPKKAEQPPVATGAPKPGAASETVQPQVVHAEAQP